MITSTLGQRIRELRMRNGFTQSGLAEGIITASMVSQIESDKAKPSFHVLEKIAKKLGISVDELIGNLEMNLVVASEYKLAKGMLSAGEFSGALPLLQRVMERNNGKLDPFEIRFDYGYCLMQLNKLDEAELTFEQLLEHSTYSHSSGLLMIQVRQMFGLIEMKRRRYQVAEYHLVKALAQLKESHAQDIQLMCSLLLNLGETQKALGNLTQAIRTWQGAIPIFQERDDLIGLGNMYMRLAQSSLLTCQHEHVAEYSQRAQACFETLSSRSEKLTFEMRLAVLQAKMGNSENAITELERVLEEFRKLCKNEETGIALTELAMLFVRIGCYEQAEESCQQAKLLLPSLHPYQAWVLRTLAGIALARNQRVVATKYLKQAADCFKLVESYKDYEETMQELADLYAGQEERDQAYQVMKEMWSFNCRIREKRGIVL